MKKVIDGYVVRLCGERLISGEWGSDSCVWNWDIDNHFFAFQEEAERFFDKQGEKFGCDYPLTFPVIEMCKCAMTFVGGNMINYDIGDTIKWYEEGDDGIDGKPCVVYNT